MSRRSRSSSNDKSNLAVYIIIALAVIGAIVAGKIYLDKRAEHFSDLNELSVSDLQNGGTSLSGNIYKITGEIVERRNLESDQGLLLMVVSTIDDKKSDPIPVHVPKDVETINLERNHGYTFKVEINQAGLPVAMDIKAQ